MPAWFDLRPLDQPKDENGIKNAATAITELIQSEVLANNFLNIRVKSYPNLIYL